MNGFVVASWVSHIPQVSAALGVPPGTLGLALLCMAAGSVLGMAVAPWARVKFTVAGVAEMVNSSPRVAFSATLTILELSAWPDAPDEAEKMTAINPAMRMRLELENGDLMEECSFRHSSIILQQ